MTCSINAESSLGLSGPVVAMFESYWPAKSQVNPGANPIETKSHIYSQVSTGFAIPVNPVNEVRINII